MRIINNPKLETWTSLVRRPKINESKLTQSVEDILRAVENQGDQAIIKFAKKYDGVTLSNIKVSEQEIDDSLGQVTEDLKSAIDLAYRNIYSFHEAQKEAEKRIETITGVSCWRKSVPIEKVGLYIPGGSAPLFSTILMLGIPAKIAGCKEIILCTPPNSDQSIHPAILYTAKLVGINNIFKIGGAQAIAAMAYGTESIPQVYKIFGPGNQYVTKAKSLVQLMGVSIDMPAGPSEVLVIADESCNPAFVASDLLSQAEHGVDSHVMLLSTSLDVVNNCLAELNDQIKSLPRAAIANQVLLNSKAIILDSIDSCLDFSNLYAPEHLILAIHHKERFLGQIYNAGSVFLGNYSCESAGDYASGTNHTLPTNGYAKTYSGVSLDSFVKKITFQELTPEGIQNIGKSIELMAEAEGLYAHKNAVSIRLRAISEQKKSRP